MGPTCRPSNPSTPPTLSSLPSHLNPPLSLLSRWRRQRRAQVGRGGGPDEGTTPGEGRRAWPLCPTPPGPIPSIYDAGPRALQARWRGAAPPHPLPPASCCRGKRVRRHGPAPPPPRAAGPHPSTRGWSPLHDGHGEATAPGPSPHPRRSRGSPWRGGGGGGGALRGTGACGVASGVAAGLACGAASSVFQKFNFYADLLTFLHLARGPNDRCPPLSSPTGPGRPEQIQVGLLPYPAWGLAGVPGTHRRPKPAGPPPGSAWRAWRPRPRSLPGGAATSGHGGVAGQGLLLVGVPAGALRRQRVPGKQTIEVGWRSSGPVGPSTC